MKKFIHKELLTGNKCFVSYLEGKKGLNPQKNENKTSPICHISPLKRQLCKHLAKGHKGMRKKRQVLVKLQMNCFTLCATTTRDKPLRKHWKNRNIQGFIT